MSLKGLLLSESESQHQIVEQLAKSKGHEVGRITGITVSVMCKRGFSLKKEALAFFMGDLETCQVWFCHWVNKLKNSPPDGTLTYFHSIPFILSNFCIEPGPSRQNSR
jgi:hypothetical protein